MTWITFWAALTFGGSGFACMPTGTFFGLTVTCVTSLYASDTLRTINAGLITTLLKWFVVLKHVIAGVLETRCTQSLVQSRDSNIIFPRLL